MPTGGNTASTAHPGARAVFWAQQSRWCHQSLCSNDVIRSTAHSLALKELPLYGWWYTIPPCTYTEYRMIDFHQASLHPPLDSKWMLTEWLDTVPPSNTASPPHVGVEVLLHNSWLWQFKKASLNQSLWPRWKRSWYALGKAGPRAGSDPLENWKICCLCWESTPTAWPSSLSSSLYWCAVLDAQWICLELLQTSNPSSHTHRQSKLLYAVNIAMCSVGTANTLHYIQGKYTVY